MAIHYNIQIHFQKVESVPPPEISSYNARSRSDSPQKASKSDRDIIDLLEMRLSGDNRNTIIKKVINALQGELEAENG